METFTFIIEAIATIGFPSAMAFYTLHLMNENDKRNDSEKEALYNYINENTKVLQKLVDKVDNLHE